MSTLMRVDYMTERFEWNGKNYPRAFSTQQMLSTGTPALRMHTAFSTQPMAVSS
jgi:hypothetical protein